MRLTLRTMLAYMDGILEAPDAHELEQKIEESKFASDLVHRIRSSTRRLRLGAPKVDGKGMAADANSVAEYLDNTMPPEDFQDFEKVCLESDVHLAEVASSHQILVTLEKFLKRASSEPALIGAPVRDRMYRIPQEAASAPAARAADDSTSAERTSTDDLLQGPPVATEGKLSPVERLSEVVRSSPVAAPVPAGRFPLKSLAITLLLGFVLAGVALRAIGEFGPNHPVLGFLVRGGDSNTVSPPAKSNGADSGNSIGKSAGSSDTSAPTKDTATTATHSNSAKTTDADPSADNSGSDHPSADKSGSPSAVPAENTTGSVEPKTTTDVEKSTSTPPLPPEPNPPSTDAATVPVVPAKPTTPAPGDGSKPTKTPTPLPPEADVPAAPINAGLYLSEEQVLARLDKASGTWMALAVNSPLAAGEELLSFPTYRPQVLVAPSVKLTLAGVASWKLHVPDATNLPRITLRHGRATLVPAGEMGSNIKIDVGGRSGLLSFADVESAAAIEVRPYLNPGDDPMSTAPHMVVQLFATSGGVEWKEADNAPVKISAGQMAAFIDDSPVQVINPGPLPDWIDGKNLSDIDRSASQGLRAFLTADRPLSLSLMEQVNFRKVEVRSLARRSLCVLDIFEPSLESLNDEQQHSFWYAQLDSLQAAMIQSAESPGKMRAAVDKLFNERADKIHRLLYGFSASDLAADGSKQLVDALESSLMAERVLASENLRRITGKTLGFRPEERPEAEKNRVANWRKLQEKGQIVYKTPPAQLTAPGAAEDGAKPAPDAPK